MVLVMYTVKILIVDMRKAKVFEIVISNWTSIIWGGQ